MFSKNKTENTASDSDSNKSEVDNRDPAEIRAEKFRMAGQRETVEAFVVAFILALLFRAFLAEAFVIPTGSMAPALMGAHKDLFCDRCGNRFQVGASLERRGPVTDDVVVAGICPNCRYTNPIDIAGEPDEETFNGDRILVSKFSYMIGDPERWDVIVFKFPGNPKQNYIKRLVGLPHETITVHHGDVFRRLTGSDDNNEILRKPPDKLLAMKHLVYDTEFQSADLIQSNYPSRWQPWSDQAETPPEDSWIVGRDADSFLATLPADAPSRMHWLRYYHRWPDPVQWEMAAAGESLSDVDPYSSRAITDFYAYGSYIHVDASRVYDEPPSVLPPRSIISRILRIPSMLGGGYSKGVLSPSYESGAGPEQFDGRAECGTLGISQDGTHWVGDLIVTASVETDENSKELMIELIEAGIQYQCQIDLTTGIASLAINDDGRSQSFDSKTGEPNLHPTAQTNIRAGSKNTIRMSNCDDEIVLWVDDNVIAFDGPTTFDSRAYLSDGDAHPKYVDRTRPLDASPVSIGVRGGASTIDHLRIDRDKYYISTKDPEAGMFDYDMRELRSITGSGMNYYDLQQLMTEPERWSEFKGWSTRRSVTFELEEDQFFPMGDNSPESLDARCWAGTKLRFGMTPEADHWARAHYVPRDLLVGKALMVFWPHSWNRPIPFTPNMKRIKLIR